VDLLSSTELVEAGISMLSQVKRRSATAASYMGSQPSAVATGTTNNSYNITVNAAPGMDVNSLASAVMDKIQKLERQYNERS
jgi:hypothetical protein